MLDLRIDSLDIRQTAVLGSIDLSIFKGETAALVGPSGVGKTTLLRIIAGLEKTYQGQCRVDGRVSVVFQEPTLLPWRTVMDNICIPTGIDDTAALAVLNDVGLDDRAHDFPNALSLGQQRRLALARAFAVKPDLLLMDEPFVSLDPALVDEMMTLFIKLRDAHDVTTIIVTHVQSEAERLANRIITLGDAPARIISDKLH